MAKGWCWPLICNHHTTWECKKLYCYSPILLNGMVFYYHKCPALHKLNAMINTVLHCISTECPMILLVKCYTDWHGNWTKLFSSCTPVTCYEYTYVCHTGAGIVSTVLLTFHLTPSHQMTTIVITLCNAQKTKEKLKSSPRICQIWHVLA